MDPSRLIAQVREYGLNGTIEGLGPYGTNLGSVASVNDQFATLLSNTIGVMTVGGGIWFTFQIIQGAITWIGAAGDKAAVQGSQKRITSAVTGLIILVGVMMIVAVIGEILGFKILDLDISTLVP